MESEKELTNTPENLETPLDEASAGTAENEAVAALTAERDKIASEKAELHELLLRRQAEFENFRKRAERERSEYIQYASMEMVASLLPILDDFERAMKSCQQKEGSDPEYRRGIELIYQRLFETLKKAGLEPVNAEGQPFDPNVHQAVVRAETCEVPEHTVLEVFQRGYNFKGKLLRPAMVKVAVSS